MTTIYEVLVEFGSRGEATSVSLWAQLVNAQNHAASHTKSEIRWEDSWRERTYGTANGRAVDRTLHGRGQYPVIIRERQIGDAFYIGSYGPTRLARELASRGT